jgi:diacylglycerol kinase family enzyme
MTQRVLIFANPIAGRGKGRLLAQRLHDRFTAEGWDSTLLFERADAVPDETTAGATAVVSIGGDGTLRSVVQRMTAGGANEGPGVVVVPMGTANLMGKHLGVGLSENGLEGRAVAAIRDRRIVRLDLGAVRRPGEAGPGQLFLLMVGVGIDGEIVHALDRVRTGPIGYLSYVAPAVGTLANYRFRPLHVEVDGRVVFRTAPAVAFVGNVAEYGTGFPILPHARSDDQLLDVCVLPASTPDHLLRHAMSTLTGEHVLGEGVVYLKGRSVRITSPEPVAVQADGDPAGHTPLDVELLPTRVAFLT